MKGRRKRRLLAASLVVLLVGGAAAIPTVLAAKRRHNEAEALHVLRQVADAQALFREADLDQDGHCDYGTLEELIAAKVIDPDLGEDLASGSRDGYHFAAYPSPRAPQFMWYATARPCEPGSSGDRYFATNHQGTAYVSGKPFAIDPMTCLPPEDVPSTCLSHDH